MSTKSYGMRPARQRISGGGFRKTYRGTHNAFHHEEAHYIINKRNENNMHFPNVNKGMARQRLENLKVLLTIGDTINKYGRPAFRYARALGKQLGEGGYGEVFETVYEEPSLTLLKTIRRRSTHWMDGTPPMKHRTVCVKLSAKHPWETYANFVKSRLKEASWHLFLATTEPVNLPGVNPVKASAFVPKFYRAGLVVDERTDIPFYVTLMSKAPGTQVQRQKPTLTADAYVRIEQAVVALWVHGIAHADLHMENVLFDPVTRQATVIDFGSGTLLSPSLKKAVQANVVLGIANDIRSLGEVWLSSSKTVFGANIEAFVNRVQYKRNPRRSAWYNPDGHALMNLYGKVRKEERHLIPTLRKQLWGFTGNAGTNMTTRQTYVTVNPVPVFGANRKRKPNNRNLPVAKRQFRDVFAKTVYQPRFAKLSKQALRPGAYGLALRPGAYGLARRPGAYGLLNSNMGHST